MKEEGCYLYSRIEQLMGLVKCAVALEVTNESKFSNNAVLELISKVHSLFFVSSSEFLDALNRGDLLWMLLMISEDWAAF